MEFRNFYNKTSLTTLMIACSLLFGCNNKENTNSLTIGVAAEEFPPDRSKQQEGKLRATALVIEKDQTKLCIVSCDILSISRLIVDEIEKKIESELGIPFSNIMITATHTHHGPNIYDSAFIKVLKNSIYSAVGKANEDLKSSRPAEMYFCLGQEATVGQNSRMLLSDSTIFWYGHYEDAVRLTGTFDPELPVIAFREGGVLKAALFNHSTHTIGARTIGSRSPSFYGLAAQELENESGGKFLFLLGAHGSIHDLVLTTDEKVFRIKQAVKSALEKASDMKVQRVESIKEEFEFRVREFDEEKEEQAVSYYCRKRMGNLDDQWIWPGTGWNQNPENAIAGFRNARKNIAKQQGEKKKTWLQVIRIGEVALVCTGGELFNELGIDIKRRSPFRYTYIVDLSNDAIGYVPDNKGFELGGYQLWTGNHSYLTKGTGEAMVDRAVEMLCQLYEKK